MSVGPTSGSPKKAPVSTTGSNPTPSTVAETPPTEPKSATVPANARADTLLRFSASSFASAQPTPIALQQPGTSAPPDALPSISARDLMRVADPLGPLQRFTPTRQPLLPQTDAFRPYPGQRPQAIPLHLDGSVGKGGRNNASDVRQIQDRLYQLGHLGADAYALEMADPAGQQPLASENLTQTLAAIEKYQREVMGTSDGRIDVGGNTHQSLKDPTYGTPTRINPGAADPNAGVSLDDIDLSANVRQVVQAIEAKESGRSTLAEIPAALINASGTPASFGRGQAIGGTALEVISHSPELAEHYGLDETQLQGMHDIARATRAQYNNIKDLMGGGSVTEERLAERITEYAASDAGARFQEVTGLGPKDMENMFRAEQLRGQLKGVRFSGSDAASKQATIDAWMKDPDVAANVQALGLRNGDLRAYIADNSRLGENREGFITRALFHSEHGQALRDAMTDNGGLPIARILIDRNYQSVVSRATALLGEPLSDENAARATLYVHNHGPGGLDRYIRALAAGTASDTYVDDAMKGWSAP
ncbi:MAG: peptidoglycan-binding protein [Cystobacter sp.]